MNTMAPEKRWTDDRLDDLDKKVDVGFAQAGKDFEKVDNRFDSVEKRFDKVDARFEAVEGKIESGIKELRTEMIARFEKVDERFESLGRTLLWSAVGVITTLIGCCATLVGVAAL